MRLIVAGVFSSISQRRFTTGVESRVERSTTGRTCA